MTLPAEGELARLDKWLWSVRIFKTRALATDACRAGSVQVNDLPAKPARSVHVGETVTVQQGIINRTFVVKGSPRSRVGGKLVPEYCEERTLPAEFAKAREQRVQQLLARDKGSGRPTKRDRRALENLHSG